jgi:F0F1-type ATP synthase membrane subunit b/b'
VIKEVRSAVTTVAIAAASDLIEQNLSDEQSEQLLKKDISNLSSLL